MQRFRPLFPGEVRIDRLLQDCRDVPTRLHLIFSKRSGPRRLQIVFRRPSVRLFEECFLFLLLVLLLIVHTMGRGPRRYQSISDILQTRCALATSRPSQRIELRKQIVLARRALSRWDIGSMKIRRLYERGRRDGILLALPGALPKLLFWAELSDSIR